MAALPYNLTSGPPTFGPTINSDSPPEVINGYPGGSLNRDEADEMCLYKASWSDAPFGPGDLEWLYRKSDVDGRGIASRLGRLAPISFLNPADGLMRRRFFSVNTWETTHFAWTGDNPRGLFPGNSRFRPKDNASFARASQLTNQVLPTPSLAHRDRRINLNYPLPVSNDPLEPVRQKWIGEAYELFKAVLPPKAIDTPAELAILSQFVINIVDFRDPDATTTQFTNPDLNLIQFGMEYCPIALNEVLAYSFLRKVPGATSGIPTNRLLVELVNTLTEAAHSTASDLDLKGWDVVIRPDDPLGRPDPWTGQIPQGTSILPIPLPSPIVVPALKGSDVADPAGNYFVLGNATPDPSSESPPIVPTATFPNDPLASPAVPTPRSGSARYYWLYLRRPANPFDPKSTSVVVDSFRFPYSEGGGTGRTMSDQDQVTQGTQPLYAVQRLQPYRGGHAVPAPLVAPNPAPPPAPYGYSEQSAPPTGNAPNPPGTGVSVTYGLYGQRPITQPIYHTLGNRNSPSDLAWDFFPFHDRDFSSVAELLLVPCCPPGLFTKRFVENPPPIAPGPASISPPALRAPAPPNAGSPFPAGIPHTFPYLADEFYTLSGQERDILERLELERHQSLQFLGMDRRKADEGLLDGGLKIGECRVVSAVHGTPFDELPQPFDQVQVRRVRRQIQQGDSQLRRQRLNHGIALIAGIVQHQRDRPGEPRRGDLPEELAHRLGVDDRGVGHADQFVGHRVPRPQHVEPLTTRSGAHKDSGERPQATQEGPEHEMGRIDEEHMALSRLSRVQDRLQLFIEKIRLDGDVLGQALRWRHRDGAGALPLQAQVPEELPHLRRAAPQSGQLVEAFAGFGYGTDGAFLERRANPVPIGGQFAHWPRDVPLSQPVQAPVSERGEVALDGGSSDPSNLGGFLTRQSAVQRPEHQHLFADPGVGMEDPLLIDDPLLLVGQLHMKPSHGAPRWIRSQTG